jgi:hypothetical protein
MVENKIIKLFTGEKVKSKEREFTKLLGGFSETSPIITDRQIADLLGYSNGARNVRERLNRNNDDKKNIEHFKFGVHILDLKSSVADDDTTRNTLKTLGYTDQAINLAKNIYVFSESGFLLYLKFAENEKSVEIYKNFIEEYFKTKAENNVLKATLQEQIETLKEQYYVIFGKAIATYDNQLLMESQKIKDNITSLEKQLTEELTVKKYKIYEDKYKQFMDSDGTFTFENASKILSTNVTGEGLNIKVNKMTLPKILREQGIISKEKSGKGYKNLPNSGYEMYFTTTDRDYKTPDGKTHIKTQTTITPKGLDFIYELLQKAN